MKKIILTGGGTSGHVTPNVALIPVLKREGFEVHYIGTKTGIEKGLIEKEGIPYYCINAGKLRRYFDFKNLTDIFRVLDGFRQAMSVIRKVRPDIIFSKGGFVSCPVVWAGWLMRVPVVIHESDMTPGLTNKLSIPFAKKICYTFPETRKNLPEGKGVLTGIPIREELLKGSKEVGTSICGFSSNKPVLLIVGGSQGSEYINSIVRKSLSAILKEYNVCHLCGKGNLKAELDILEGYKQFEYINEELKDIFAVADIVISRAGATTLFELIALKKPHLLIPLSKKASRGDQILNALSFENQGFSYVVMEEELTEEKLLKGIKSLKENSSDYIKIMKQSEIGASTEKVMKILREES